MKKLFFPAFFIILGIISLLGQIVILREITSLFYGNELFYCLGLGLWMFFTGLGSLLAYKIPLPRIKIILYFLLLSLMMILLPTLIILLRFLVAKSVPQGQLPNFTYSLLVLTGVLFGFCFLLGLIFPIAISCFSKNKKNSFFVNSAYFWETIGLTFAGLIFSFILYSTSFPLPTKIDRISLGWRYKNIVTSIYSKYNQIIITKNGSQRNYFLNGQLTFTNQEKWDNQRFVQLLTPFMNNNQNMIVFGNPNLAVEIKNSFQQAKVNFLEIDNQLLDVEKKLLTKKIIAINADPRQFFKNTTAQWDSIFFSLGNPQTLLANRYFTKECFSIIKTRLSNAGVFVLAFYIPTDYVSEEAFSYSRSIYQTFLHVFPHEKLLILDDQLILMGSKSPIIIDQSKINAYWRKNFWQTIKDEKKTRILGNITAIKEKINSDIEPMAFFNHQLFWQTMFDFTSPQIILIAGKVLPFVFLAILFIGFFQKKRNLKLGCIIANSSFVLMGLETLIIVLFQTNVGYLYSKIALIFGSVLFGMAIGVRSKSNSEVYGKISMTIFFGYLPIFFILLLIIFGNLEIITDVAVFWYALAFYAGLIGGMIFKKINEYYLQREKNPGYIYAFDLFGGCLGALCVSGLFLPIYGITGVIVYFFTLVLINLFFIAKLRE